MGRLASAPRKRPSAGEIVRGLAGVVAIAALVAGVPAALWWAVGWPLPHAVPSLAELREALSRPTIPDEFFPKALATLAWLAWAQFLACLFVEALAARRGRLPRRVPGAGWGSQALASNLMAAVLLLLPAPAMASAATPTTERPVPVVQTFHPSPGSASATPGSRPAQQPARHGMQSRTTDDATERARKLPRYVVHRRDTLWAIAERHLGDPLRWSEIFELNEGRLQPDGRRLQLAHWIYPGWELLLPHDAVGVPTPPAQSSSHPETHPTPGPAPATEPNAQPPVKAHKPQPPATTRNAQAPTSPAPTTAHTAKQNGSGNGYVPPGIPVPGIGGAPPGAPGSAANPSATKTTAPPPTTEPPSTTEPPPPTQTEPPRTSHAEPASTHARELARPDEHRGSDSMVPAAALAGAGLLAAGVLATLGVLRKVQQRRRGAGRRIALPDAGLTSSELALRAGEQPELAERLDVALRALAAGVVRDHMEMPEVLGVLLGPEFLEVLLGGEAEAAPAPFVLSHSRRRWGLPNDMPLEDLRSAAVDASAPLPGLVTLGQTEEGLLLVNLEAPGIVALGGDEVAARALLASFAVELATSRWTDYIDLLLVGFGEELQQLERVRVARDLIDLLPLLERQADEIALLLNETGAASIADGRLGDVAGDSWAPTLLLCASPPTPEETNRLAALTAVPARSPVAAVVTANAMPGARWTLELPAGSEETLRFGPLDLDVRPQLLDSGDYGAVASLLHTATAEDVEEPLLPPPEPPSREPAWDPRASSNVPDLPTLPEFPDVIDLPEDLMQIPEQLETAEQPYEEPEEALLGELSRESSPIQLQEAPEVEVRVLGRIEISGIERIERGKSEELIVFLALHPEGVDSDQLSEALWPGRPPARGTLNTTTTVARAHLGNTREGAPRLPHAHNGIYRLDPSVGLDWARFRALAAGGLSGGVAAAADLQGALELVRGRPFEAVKPRAYGWALLDQVPTMESMIVDAADRLAGLRLDEGDHAGAQWAARRGLTAAPYDERLYRRLMLAADTAGNPSGVEAIMDELLRRLDSEDLEPYDSLHEHTRELYERLRRNRSISNRGA